MWARRILLSDSIGQYHSRVARRVSRLQKTPFVNDNAQLSPALKGIELTKTYPSGRGRTVTALKGVSLSVQPGEVLAVIGPSGSGKTTLLHILGCLERPSSGRLFVDGEEITKASTHRLPHIRNRYIGFLFQEHRLIPTLTAIENVQIPLRLRGVSRKKALEAAGEWLDRVGLSSRRHHLPGELSGGERQRVAIARAVIHGPKAVLADEPTGELDSKTSRHLIELFHSLNCETGQTFVLVTHDPQVAASCHRVITLRDGQVVA